MSKHKHKQQHMQKEKPKQPSKLAGVFNRRRVIVIFLLAACLAGLPLKLQNIKLNGYISDDAWWHFRQVKQVVETGHRLDPDIYEFVSLSRPQTYPPLFHYVVAYSYRLLRNITDLITYTHYFNILEGFLYILLIYAIAYLITADKLFSIIGALSASVSYGVIIRARAGELMPFVLGDLFALVAILFLLIILRNPDSKKTAYCSLLSGLFFALSMLSWSGSIMIYVPLIFFAFVSLVVANRHLYKKAIILFFLCLVPFFIATLPWYLPILKQYGINPHSAEMDWFMKNFTVLHQVKPLNFYIFTTGVSIFFLPIAFLICLFRRKAVNLFFLSWIILAAVATYTGWRGYVAVVPIVSAVALGFVLSKILRFLFKEGSLYIPVAFIILFLAVGGVNYRISSLRISPLNPHNIGEVRTNARSIKMLEFLKKKYPRAITIDHISWVSEDAAVGDLRMVGGQYLEYLPKGSSSVLKDISRFYVSEEKEAYEICKKYDTDLIIVRRQFLILAQLSILFAPPELKSEDYLTVTKEFEGSSEISINFKPKGMRTMLFLMLNRTPLEKFELVYADTEGNQPIPFLVVYKLSKE